MLLKILRRMPLFCQIFRDWEHEVALYLLNQTKIFKTWTRLQPKCSFIVYFFHRILGTYHIAKIFLKLYSSRSASVQLVMACSSWSMNNKSSNWLACHKFSSRFGTFPSKESADSYDFSCFFILIKSTNAAGPVLFFPLSFWLQHLHTTLRIIHC